MSKLEDCPICRNSRHIYVKGNNGVKGVKCECLKKVERQERLSHYVNAVAEEDIIDSPRLRQFLRKSCWISGEIYVHAPYISGIFLNSPGEFSIWYLPTAFNVHEAYIGNAAPGLSGGDKNKSHLGLLKRPDLLIIPLWTKHPTTHNLGNVIYQIYHDRRNEQKATWFLTPSVVLNTVEGFYGSEVTAILHSLYMQRCSLAITGKGNKIEDSTPVMEEGEIEGSTPMMGGEINEVESVGE